MAPEIQGEDGYTMDVDWWSLGILCYEMMVGFAPFTAKEGEDPDAVYKRIRKKKVLFPSVEKHGIEMSEECKDFIRKCTEKAPERRLGHEKDLEEVIGHPWFEEFDKEQFESRKYEASYKPTLSADILDTSNFDDPETDKNEIGFSEVPKE